MSSTNHTLYRKRLRCSDYRDSDSDEEFRPSKLRRRHGTRVPLIVSEKVKNLLAWITDLGVSNFFKMSVKNGSELPLETVVLDDSENEEDEIQEVVRLHEKIQYKMLLDKYISAPLYHRASKKPSADVEALADSSLCTNSHFTKDVLNQPTDPFIQKFYNKPCQLVNNDKVKDTNEKEKPSEIKMDDDDDKQISDVKLPEPRTRRKWSSTKYLTREWLADLQDDVKTKAAERARIDEAYQKELERLKKEHVLNLLGVESVSSQAAEPEFPVKMDDDDDDKQISDVKLPEPRTRHQWSTKYLTSEWLADLKIKIKLEKKKRGSKTRKIDVSTKAAERTKIDEAYQKELERLAAERTKIDEAYQKELERLKRES